MARTRFSASSRYELDEGGITASRLPQETVLYLLHVIQAEDTLETIAYRLLGDHMRWWEIADLNPQLMHTHCGVTGLLNLTPGDTIRVPS